MSKKKFGRPPLPKEKAKDILIGARFSPPEVKQVLQSVAESDTDKSEWLRQAAREVCEAWIKPSPWSIEDLHGKTVEFELVTMLEGPIRGTGTFDAWQRGDGLAKIRIISFHKSSTEYSRDELRVYVPQQGVKLIKRQPPGSRYDFSIFDPAFQRAVKRPT